MFEALEKKIVRDEPMPAVIRASRLFIYFLKYVRYHFEGQNYYSGTPYRQIGKTIWIADSHVGLKYLHRVVKTHTNTRT